MAITRRILLSSGAALGGAIAAGPAAAQAVAQAAAQTAAQTAANSAGRTLVRAIPRRQGTTLASIFSRGVANTGGYQRLVRRGGERHLVRTDLGVKAKANRKDRRRGLIAFVQLSDVHIIDAQSPLRVEWTDRFDDPGPTVTGTFTSAYRPWEMLSGQIADSMVRRINRIRTGPVTGRKLALAIQTGDNSQFNEIRWNIDLLGGARVAVDSGDRSRYEGVCDSDPVYYDRAYWHPDGPPPGALADAAMRRCGDAAMRRCGDGQFRLPEGTRAPGRRSPTLPGPGSRHAVVHRLREPRRSRPGKLSRCPSTERDRHRAGEDHLAAGGRQSRRTARRCWRRPSEPVRVARAHPRSPGGDA